MLAFGRVVRNHKSTHASTVVLPVPFEPTSAVCGERGTAASTSCWYGSGSAPKASRTNRIGSRNHPARTPTAACSRASVMARPFHRPRRGEHEAEEVDAAGQLDVLLRLAREIGEQQLHGVERHALILRP